MRDPTFVVFWRWAWLGIVPGIYLTAISGDQGFVTLALITYGGAGLAAAVTGTIGFPAATRGALWWIAITLSSSAKYLPLWEMWTAGGLTGLWAFAYVFVGPFAVVVLGGSLDPIYRRQIEIPSPSSGQAEGSGTAADPARADTATSTMRPAGAAFRRGVQLLSDDNPKAALDEFQRALDEAVGDQKADSFYNIAACHSRLGNADAALQAVSAAVSLDPSLAPEIASDPDFAAFRSNESFQKIIMNPPAPSEGKPEPRVEKMPQEPGSMSRVFGYAGFGVGMVIMVVFIPVSSNQTMNAIVGFVVGAVGGGVGSWIGGTLDKQRK